MRLVFLGPPGSGKGTYASRVAPKLGIPHIGTGDIIRKAIAEKTPVGIEAEKYYNEGKPIPNEISTKAIIERISQPDCKDGFVLDSPYNREQAEAIDKIAKIDIAINLSVSEDIIIERLSTRRVCKKCGAIYNIRTLKPKVDGICDKCGGELYQREDDKPETIKKRFEEYEKRVGPLIDYYKNRGILVEIGFTKNEIPEGYIDMPLEIMLSKIMEAIKNFENK